eukprot:4362513-Amphidinium_carterae.1
MHKHRASPDALHFSHWSHIFPHIKKDLGILFTQIVASGRCPIAFKGAEVVPIRKRGKPADKTSSYRPVMLMLSSAKLFSRLCMQKLAKCLAAQCSLPKSQHALGTAAGVEIPHVIMAQCSAWAAQAKASMAVIYLDVKAAFDAVLRQLLVPGLDHEHVAAQQLHEITRQPVEECARVIQYVRQCPMALTENSLPRELVHVIGDWTTGTWFRPRDSASGSQNSEQGAKQNSVVLAPSTGVRQGDNLSGLLFAVYIEQALEKIIETVRASECKFELARPELRTLQVREDTVRHIIPLITYADDVAIPLQSINPGVLLELVKRLLGCACRALSQFNFQLNTAADKSAVSLNLRSKHAPKIWQHLRDEAFAHDSK